MKAYLRKSVRIEGKMYTGHPSMTFNVEADKFLHAAGLFGKDHHPLYSKSAYFFSSDLPQAIAVLRFHGFEVEVEE